MRSVTLFLSVSISLSHSPFSARSTPVLAFLHKVNDLKLVIRIPLPLSYNTYYYQKEFTVFYSFILCILDLLLSAF